MSHELSSRGQVPAAVIGVAKRAASTPMPPYTSSRRRKGWASEPDALPEALATKVIPDPATLGNLRSTSPPEGSQPEDNSSAQRLREDLERAHSERLPGARILLVRPPAAVDKNRIFAPQLHPALFISQTRDGRSIMGVLQRTKDVDFTFMVPFIAEPSRFFTYPTVDELRGTICYNPASDECEFICVSHSVIVIGETSNMSFILKRGHIQSMEPGMWKIAIPTNGRETHPRPLVDFLLLKRKFEVVMEQPKVSEETAPLHPTSGGVSMIRISSTKAVCEDTITEFLMETLKKRDPGANSASHGKQAVSNAGFGNLPPTAQAAASDDNGQLPEIRDGQIANIVTAPLVGGKAATPVKDGKQAEDSYRVTHLEHIDKNRNSSVFACLHSKIPNTTLVAKILNVRPRSIASISSIAHSWRQEMQMLQRLNHPNIVMMKAFDARFFAIYLEHLPDSLSPHTSERHFSHQDAATILRDVSSALAHLDTKGISHNDIKPSNIAYSPERGAVVLDFGLATNGPAGWTGGAGGTAWYVAPEAADLGVRDGISNVWSLGVTMLYVLGCLDEPEVYGKAWNFSNVRDPNSDDREAMENWLEEVYCAREGLDVEDMVQGLVYDMLERDPRFRVTARTIEETLRSAE